MFENTLVKVILRSFLLSALAIGATTVNAEISRNFEFQVIEGYDSSTAILEGNYAQAVELANSTTRSGTLYDRAVNATSLCVAYAKLSNIDQAIDACSKAVKASARVYETSKLDRIARNNRKVVQAFAETTP